jgi:acyl carrier protein
MESNSMIQELEPIFRDVLDQPDLRLVSGSNAANVEGWDSLAHVNLVVAIEKQYHIKFALGELQELKDVGDMVELIARKLERR